MIIVPEIYGPAFARLLRIAPDMPLGQGETDANILNDLRTLHVETAFEPKRVENRAMAECCFAGVWLYFNYFDTAHTIVQDIPSREASLWHGIIHRRDGDFWNSGYWFRKAGYHPIFSDLKNHARRITRKVGLNTTTSLLVHQEIWDPLFFIELVEKSAGSGTPTELTCRQIQQIEWQLLFEYCFNAAVGE